MNAVDGQVRKIESLVDAKTFYDFEFWAESDEDNYGLVCLTQLSNPTNLFITRMNEYELSNSDNPSGFKAVKERLEGEINVKDLVHPKVIRFEKNKQDVKGGFQTFLKSYQKAIPVYESIFETGKEAVQVEVLSIDEFKKMGGKITNLIVE